MPTSLESSRPIMLPSTRTSVRLSTYSVTPSVSPTVHSESATAEIQEIKNVLHRMENRALSQQRVNLNEEKIVNLQTLALGAKLDRALNRRMSGQDAVMRKQRKPATKVAEKEKA